MGTTVGILLGGENVGVNVSCGDDGIAKGLQVGYGLEGYVGRPDGSRLRL